MVISISGIHGVGVFLPILLCPACRKICALGPSESSNPSIQLCRSLHVVRTIHNRWILPAFLWGCGGIRTLLRLRSRHSRSFQSAARTRHLVPTAHPPRRHSAPLHAQLGRAVLPRWMLDGHPGDGRDRDLACSRRDRVVSRAASSREGLARLTC